MNPFTRSAPIPAELILQLDSKAKLGLNDPISKYLPGYPYGEQITIKNLLTHTSGIYDYSKDNSLAGMPVSMEALVESFKNKPSSFEPGMGVEYCNSNYILLGCIIEKITHRKYEEQIRAKILNTCGMSHSGFDFANLKDENKTTGYFFINKDNYKAAPGTDSSYSYAAGAMYSDVGDLYKWHNALHGYHLLPKDWQDIAYAPVKNQYALGWTVEQIMGRKFVEHSGDIAGFSSYEMRQEQDDVFIILLENNMQPGTSNSAIAKNIVKCLYDKSYKVPGEKKEMFLSLETMNKYVGEYQFTPDASLIVSLNGTELTAASPTIKSIRMIAENRTLFRIEGMDDQVEFVKGKDGKFNKVILYQQGQRVTGVRVN